VQQEFGGWRRRLVSWWLACTVRSRPPIAAAVLTRDAFGVGGDTLLRFKAASTSSEIARRQLHQGEAPAIERIQRSNIQYAQRPDRTYAQLDRP